MYTKHRLHPLHLRFAPQFCLSLLHSCFCVAYSLKSLQLCNTPAAAVSTRHTAVSPAAAVLPATVCNTLLPHLQLLFQHATLLLQLRYSVVLETLHALQFPRQRGRRLLVFPRGRQGSL